MKYSTIQIFTLLLLITLAVPAFASKVLADIEYFYADDGSLIGKAFNGKRVNFEYDLRGQLLAVKDALGNDLERYTYDPAGNRLSKTINGVTTTYSYDEANQLIRSTVNGEITYYEYDAAGRMIQAGDKSYIYNGNNKVIEVRQNGETIAKFEYNIDGQIAKAIYGDKKEEFIWDGLALIWRSGVTYINEPYVTGGNPVMAGDDVLFNDMLGSTLAVNDKAVEMTSFGETDNENVFFTGKPMIDELGYSFLFRDYNPNHGKWTTVDPLGYPDGWNQLAYCGNRANIFVDKFGMWATGVAYAIIDNDVPWYASSNRDQDNDKSLANKSDNYFAMSGEPLSQALVEYAQTQTGDTAIDFTVDSKYFPQIEADSGFAAVRTYVATKMRGVSPNGSVTFSKETDHLATTLVSKDLNHAIHGVIFYLDGSIKVDASGHWKGNLTVSFSDPYDFNASASDWKVRVWGRLYDHGWISKFNATGSWTVNFEE